jgi:hypothetical protein
LDWAAGVTRDKPERRKEATAGIVYDPAEYSKQIEEEGTTKPVSDYSMILYMNDGFKHLHDSIKKLLDFDNIFFSRHETTLETISNYELSRHPAFLLLKPCSFLFKIESKRDNMENLLVKSNEYNGRYVALKSFEDHTVVGVGDDPESAIKDARSKGFQEPVIIYVTETDTVHIY